MHRLDAPSTFVAYSYTTTGLQYKETPRSRGSYLFIRLSASAGANAVLEQLLASIESVGVLRKIS